MCCRWQHNGKPYGHKFKQINSTVSELYCMLHSHSHHPQCSHPEDARPRCASFVSFRLIDALDTSSHQFQLHQLHFHLMMVWGSGSKSACKQGSTTSFELCCVSLVEKSWFDIELGIFVGEAGVDAQARFLHIYTRMLSLKCRYASNIFDMSTVITHIN